MPYSPFTRAMTALGIAVGVPEGPALIIIPIAFIRGEILSAGEPRVHPAVESAYWAKTRRNPARVRCLLLGEHRKFPNFIQKSIHRMSEPEGEADQDFGMADFRIVPKADIRGSGATRKYVSPSAFIRIFSSLAPW